MNWSLLIQCLIDSGLTQAEIARQVGSGQSHISSIYQGKRKQPGWQLGDRLIDLLQRRVGEVSADVKKAA